MLTESGVYSESVFNWVFAGEKNTVWQNVMDYHENSRLNC